MELVHVAAALFSALLHAGWNAAVKAHPRTAETMTAQMMLAGIIIIPGFYWTGFPAAAAWPWILTSTSLNIVALTAMLRAYEIGGFGMVYPIMRAVSLLCVVPLSALIAGDTLSPGGIVGVAMIASALAVLAFGAGRDTGFPRAALLWTMLSGATLALYVLSDARGVRASGSALAYGFTASIANGLVMAWRQRHLGSPLQHISSTWRVSLPAAVASSVSYLLILWVWSVERRFRPEDKQVQPWIDRQWSKINRALAMLEANPPQWSGHPDYGHITLACALGYLDFRHQGTWRAAHPRLVAWLDSFSKAVPAFAATQPVG